jgi:ABC-type antimicrobial peptide transport system permease subunit
MIPLSYSLRSLSRRPVTAIVTLVGLTLVVLVFAAVLMLSNGVRDTLAKNGSPDNFLAVRDGATSEATSLVSIDQARLFSAEPELVRGAGGQALVDAELVVIGSFERPNATGDANVLVRGVGPQALAVRSTVKVTQGHAPNPGTSEIMIGKSLVGHYAGFQLGSKLPLAKRDWEIVGVFEAEGSALESEIWGDVDQISDAFSRRGALSEIVGRLQDRSSGIALLQGKVASDPQLSTLKIWREDAFYETQSASLSKLITGLGLFVAVIFSAAAALGAAITMYAQVAGRVREVGTLRAIGFRRRSVLLVFLREAVLLSLVGGILGIALASLFSLTSFSASNQDSFTDVTFHFRFGLGIAIKSLIFAMIMGLLGGFSPAWRASRLSIVSATRGG